MRLRMLLAVLIGITFVAFPLVQARAQLMDVTQGITLSLSPQYPRPYDIVTVTPQSTSFNLSASTVTISANGTIIEEGSGGRSASVALGGPGSSTTIKVTAVSGGVTYTAEATVRPADVALVVEPLTTRNPLYKGASLVAPEGRVRVVALPEFRSAGGVRINNNSLIYTWRLGNRILTEDSGIGRSVLAATAPVRYRTADVSVTVTNADESMVGYASASVAPASPAVYVYRDDPLLGLDLSRTISGSFAMAAEEETFRAVPFNFAIAPDISWTLGGNSASTNQSLTVRTTNSNSGSAAASVVAQDLGGESARTSFTVNFNARKSGTLFGF